MRQALSREARVVVHLRRHDLDAVEADLVAQARDEVDVESRAVQVAVVIEEVHLEQPASAADGRPRADRRVRIRDGG